VLGAAATDPAHLGALVDRRVRGEPLEQVVGYADFCGIRVRLRPGVFVPRVRSELLVSTAVANLRGAGATVVDLCCGSGALGLAVRRQAPTVRLLAADSDPAAVACALDNLGADVFQGDLFAALPGELRGRIDVLLANVPYVATGHLPLLPAEARLHEPRSALDGGPDGLDVFRAVVAGAAGWLAPGGLLLSEITEAQTDAAVAAAGAAGLCPEVVEDENLEARAIIARRPELQGGTGLR
jgi:release factor glutamine methyltransferase